MPPASVRRRAVLALAIALCCACAREPELPRPKNVVLLVVDTLRANHLGCYGYPRATSPAIDALAHAGTLYEDNHSQACWTIPSMISLMSGLYVTQDETALPKVPTLAEVLRAGGLETAAFLSNAALGTDRGFQRGFEHFEELYEHSAIDVATAFEAWYDARPDKDARFFAWVHFIDPHQPYQPPPEWDVFHDKRPDYDRLLPRWEAVQPKVAALSPKVESSKFEDAVQAMVDETNRYDGEVRTVDEGVRRIVERLRSTGQLADTLIVVCADHGEMLWEHPHSPMLIKQQIDRTGGLPGGVFDLFVNGHRPWYYQDLWNTPLIFSGPGFPADRRMPGLATNLDIYPTILQALDLNSVPGLQGESLWGGRAPARERSFAYGHEASAVVDRDGRKLVVYPRKWFSLEGDGEEPAVLYDLRVDPEEKGDLSKSRAADVAQLRQAIDAWRAQNARDAVIDTSEAQRRVLEKMGYTEGKPSGGK